MFGYIKVCTDTECWESSCVVMLHSVRIKKNNGSVEIYFLNGTPAKPSSHSSAEGKRGYKKLMRDVTQSRCGLCGVADRFGARG